MAETFLFSAAGDFSSFERGAQSAWDKTQGYINKRPLKIKIDDQASQPLGRITAGVGNFDRALDAATKRVLTFGIVAKSFAKLEEGVNAFVRSTISVQDALTRINVGLNQSQKGLQAFSSSLFNIARDTGQTFDDTAKAAEKLSKQNLGVAETTKRLKDVMTLTRIAGIDSVQAFSAMSSTLATFRKEGLTSTDVIDKLTVANNKFGVSAEDAAEAIQRTGLVAQQAGVGFDKLLGLITAVQRVTGRDGASIGTSFNKVFAGLEKPETREKLNSFGIAVKNNQGGQLAGDQILQNIALKRAQGALNQNAQAEISEIVSGQRQEENFIAILDELAKKYNLVSESVKAFNNARGQGANANAQQNESFKSLINSAGNSFTQLSSNIGIQAGKGPLKTAVNTIDGIKTLFSGKDQGGSEAGEFLGNAIIKGIVGVISGPAAAVVGKVLILALQKTLSFAKTDLSSLVGLNTESEKRAQIQSKINELLKFATQEELKEINNSKTLLGAREALLDVAERYAKVSGTQSSISNGLAATFGKGDRKILGLAGGYMPAIASEMSAISSGVGGASSSAKPVVIPKFNFANGAVGPVVANTDEYHVPNFAGGADAIFNKNMVSKYGVPDGAKHLAGGYIPNFAEGDQPFQFNKIGINGLKGSDDQKLAASQLKIINKKLIDVQTIDFKDRRAFDAQLEKLTDIVLGTSKDVQLNKDSQAKLNQKIAQIDAQYTQKTAQKVRNYQDEFASKGGNSQYIDDDGNDVDSPLTEGIAKRSGRDKKQLLRDAKALEAKQKRRETIQKYGFGAALAAPFLAGLIPDGESGTTGGKLSGAVKGGIEYASSATALGLGPINSAIVGLGGALIGYLNKSSKGIDELTEELHKSDDLGGKFASGSSAASLKGINLSSVLGGDKSAASINYIQSLVSANKNNDINGQTVNKDNVEDFANAIAKAVQILGTKQNSDSSVLGGQTGRQFLGPKDFLNYSSESAQGFRQSGAKSRLLNFDTSRDGGVSTPQQRAQNNLAFYDELQKLLPEVKDPDAQFGEGYTKNRKIVQQNNVLDAAASFLQGRNPAGRYRDVRGNPIASAVNQGLDYQKTSSNKDVVEQANILAAQIANSQPENQISNRANAYSSSKHKVDFTGNNTSSANKRGHIVLNGVSYDDDTGYSTESLNQYQKSQTRTPVGARESYDKTEKEIQHTITIKPIQVTIQSDRDRVLTENKQLAKEIEENSKEFAKAIDEEMKEAVRNIEIRLAKLGGTPLPPDNGYRGRGAGGKY
jgi:TP901 family phage tail tape measure protein